MLAAIARPDRVGFKTAALAISILYDGEALLEHLPALLRWVLCPPLQFVSYPTC